MSHCRSILQASGHVSAPRRRPPWRTLVAGSAKTTRFWAGSGGLFVYEEFKIASWADLGLIYLGLFLLVVGVCLVVFCRPLPRGEQEKGDEAAEPQTASA